MNKFDMVLVAAVAVMALPVCILAMQIDTLAFWLASTALIAAILTVCYLAVWRK